MFRPFEGTVGRMSNDVIVPWHGRQVQAYREYKVRCAGPLVDDAAAGRTPAAPSHSSSPEEFEMPVLHVRQVAKCLGSMPPGAAGVTSAPKNVQDSAVRVLGCSVSSPEWLG